MAPRLLYRHIKNTSRVTACFTSASVANHLPVWCFLSSPKGWKSLSPLEPTERLTGYGATAVTLWITLPTVLVSRPLTAISLDSLRNTWMVKWFATDADVKQAVIRLFLLCRDTSLWAKVRQILKSHWWLRGRVWCVPSATHVLSIQRCLSNAVDVTVFVILTL